MADYNPNVLESTDAWIRQWYNYTTSQLNNIISDSDFAVFYEKYFLMGAEKIKSGGYHEEYKSLMRDYKHVLRRNMARLNGIKSRRKSALQLALLLIALNYLPVGSFGFDIALAAKKLKFLGIGM